MIILRERIYSTRMGRFLAGVNKKILRKPGIKSKRDAIKIQDLISNKYTSAKYHTNDVVSNPGGFVVDSVAEAVKSPITSTTLAVAVPVPGTELIAKYVGKPERYILKKTGLGQHLNEVSDKIKNSKYRPMAEGIVNGALESIKAMVGG